RGRNAMELKAGARLRSTADTTEVVVVKTPGGDVDVRCGGHPMVAITAASAAGTSVETGFDQGTQLGKRYTNEGETAELLCTRPGDGSLSLGDEVLLIKGAKPLPSSD